MISQNTSKAIEQYELVLRYEALLRSAQKELDDAELYIPEIEKEYYNERKKELKNLREGKDSDEDI